MTPMAGDGDRAQARLGAIDAAHQLHPFTDNRALAAEGGPLVIDRGRGSHVWDASGNRYLDAFAGLWCVNVGYGRPELAEVAKQQIERLAYYNMFFKTTTAPTAQLAERLAALMPEGMNRAVFANSGSEAIETAIRIARQYWSLLGKPEKKVLIGREDGYHGSTMAAASLGGIRAMHAHIGLPLADFHHVEAPYHFMNAPHLPPRVYGKRAANALRRKIEEIGPDRVAAVALEPVQGAGGCIFPPEGYLSEVQRICRELDVLLIADEVVCAFGRVGAWSASELWGLQPDFMTLAKGLSSGYQPISATMMHDRIAHVLLQTGDFSHGFTYAGHPVAAAVALENLRIIEAEGLVERTRDETGPYLAARLAELSEHPFVGEVRSVGLLGAVELVRDKSGPVRFDPVGLVGAVVRDRLQQAGIILRSVRDTIVLAPPLIVERRDIDRLVGTLSTILDGVRSEVGVIDAERRLVEVRRQREHALEGRVALVTGAGRGIGAAVARRFAKEGATVVLVARSAPEIEAVAADIAASGGRAHAMSLDLLNEQACSNIVEKFAQISERLDIMVLNAGLLGTLEPLSGCDTMEFSRVLETNLSVNQRLLHALHPLLEKSDAGRVLAVTSGAARGRFANWSAYAASKAGLEAMIRTYAAETCDGPIRAVCVDPGEVRTGMRAAAFPDEDPDRLPEPDRIAETFVRLALPENDLGGAIVTAKVEDVSDGAGAGTHEEG